MQGKLVALIAGVSMCAVVMGDAAPDHSGKSTIRIWQDGTFLLVQKSGGRATLHAPGAYNSYPDYRVLSRSGRTLAFPFHSGNGWELDWIDLASKKTSILEQGKDAYWAKVSSSDRYLSALVDAVYTVFDLTTGEQRLLDSGIGNVIWSRRGDTLFFRKANGAIGAFDARANKLFEPNSSLIDREAGIAYRMYMPKSKSAPPADISPSGEFAFMGAVKGGFVATPVNGRYYMDFGITEPYLFGVTDSHGRVRKFAAPAAYRRQVLFPLAWTRSNELIFAIEDHSDKLLQYNPKSGRVVVKTLKRPTHGADLVAMSD